MEFALSILAALQSVVGGLIPFLLVLSLVVVVHEMGHFLAAKSFGVAIDQFSLGFGRTIARWQDRSGVEWRLGWLPLGGYVRFSGDENEASVPDRAGLEALRKQVIAREGPGAERKYYHFKPVWQRAIIAAAGPFANFVLAIAIFTLLMSAIGEVSQRARVSQVVPASAAAVAGFAPGDIVLRADKTPIKSFEDLQRYVALRANTPIVFLVDRAGAQVTLFATPGLKEIDDKIAGRQKIGVIGLAAKPGPEDLRRVRYNVFDAAPHAVARTWEIITSTGFYLRRLITGQVAADQISGVIGIVHVSGEVAKAADSAPAGPLRLLQAAVNLLSLSAVLSVSIGLLNLLPIPILDGGHLLFYAYEAVARRPLAAGVQAVGYRAGLALVVGFMLFAAWNDLHRYDVFKFLGGLFS